MSTMLGRMVNGIFGAITGFREGYLNADTLDTDLIGMDFDAWSRWEARRIRYAMFWAMYQNSSYRDVHTWARKYKADYGMYRNSRALFNPTFRLVEFHASHLMGGQLDRAAGSGKETRSAIPIDTENEAIRRPIAATWKTSDWHVGKSIWTRYGAMMGDVGLKVCDLRQRRKVRFQVIHPKHLKWVGRDCEGNVTGYIQEELRYDPQLADLRDVDPRLGPQSRLRYPIYTEECFRDGAKVVFRTFKDGRPFDWRNGPDGRVIGDGPGAEPQWEEDYPFVPLVMTQHNNMGLDWGLAEIHPVMGKVREVDDLASKIGDQVRRHVEPKWFFAGVKRSDMKADNARQDPSTANPEPGRQEEIAVYASDWQATVKPMVANLDMESSIRHVANLLEELEKELPELASDIWATGATSGSALRIARQRAEAKINERRAGYEHAMVAAHKMAIVIGAMGGGEGPYPGYEGFGPEDYEAETLDHQIGARPAFATDEVDRMDQQKTFWGNMEIASRAGCPNSLYLSREGWGPDELAEFKKWRIEESTWPKPVGDATTETSERFEGVVPGQEDLIQPHVDATTPAPQTKPDPEKAD